MIRSLQLTNFRRHASTEIFFDGAGQITLISGLNGAGKSTIIESIIYALYGEGRHGNRNIDQMIRRGAEIEGLEVEIEFDVADTLYRVKRRRDNRLSSAVLWGNDVALVEGPREVTSAVSHLLGMDARGFRLAVVAQQKELDGLASMRPAERAQMLARLLRLDVVTQAKERARTIFRSERDALRGLGSVENPARLSEELDALRARGGELDRAIETTSSSIAELNTLIVSGNGVEEEWQRVSAQVARLDAMVNSAQQEHGRLTQELTRSTPEAVSTELPDLSELAERVAVIERSIAAAEANAVLSGQVTMVSGELADVTARIGELTQESSAMVDPDVATLEESVTHAQTKLDLSRSAHHALVGELGRLEATHAIGQSRVDELQELGATCAACGQEVTPEHRTKELTAARARLRSALSAMTKVRAKIERTVEDLNDATVQLANAEQELREVQHAAARRRSITAEIAELERRRTTYANQLQRISVEDFDLDDLYTQRGSLAIEVSRAQALHEAARVAELAAERRRTLEESLAGAQERLSQSRLALDEAQPSEDLLERYRRWKTSLDAVSIEEALRSDLANQRALNAERINSAAREVERLEQQRARRSELEHHAQVASECATVLEHVGTRLNQQIRPSLEGAVGELLSRLSDGRFDAVSLDADYNLSVRDDGKFRPLGEFSGGEIDLIALAMRLALASVVSERHGAGGAGFLILDECFGSQDHDRRVSILTALRGLRGVYGQILLISHVGGLEDSADHVIEISRDEETGVASASTEN